MLGTLFSYFREPVEFTILGFTEAAFLAIILYYIYAKTRTVGILTGLINFCINAGERKEGVPKANAAPKESYYDHKYHHGVGTNNMLKITPHAGWKPFGSFFDWGVHFPHVAQALRTRKFSYPQVLPLVKKDPILQATIKQVAEQILRQQLQEEANESVVSTGNELNLSAINEKQKRNHEKYQRILKKQERRATKLLKEMHSTLNNFLLAFTSWLLYKLLPCFLHGVVTNTKQIEMLKATSERAPGIPLIFLPLHRSHLDYIMVTFILTNNNIRSPLVAAGNNLQIPVFGRLLRGLGAFFIKRKIDPVVGKKDILYRTVLHLYLQHALKLGHNVEFFMEGGRTRTGKPCMPKGGILSVIVNAFMDRSIPDALLVPVSVNYERLVDGNFVCEQKGEKKVPETFGKAISAILKALNSNYGLMHIDFNEPYSLKDLVQTYKNIALDEGFLKISKPSARTLQHNQSTSSLYGTDVVCEDQRNLIDNISRQIVYDCAAATSVMSTNALAFLLLTRHRTGVLCKKLADSFDELRESLKGQKDFGFSGDSKDIINYAANLLGETLVKRKKTENGDIFIHVNDNIESWIELAYYANTLTPHFALQSILLITFHNLLKDYIEERNAQKKDIIESKKDSEMIYAVSRKSLLEAALHNCDVYRYEYILHKPTQSLQQVLDITIDKLVAQNLLKIQETEEFAPTYETNKIAHTWENILINEHIEYDMYTPNYTDADTDKPEIFLQLQSLELQKAICEALAPFGYTYLYVAESLYNLYKNPMLESDFIQLIIKMVINNVKIQKCPYAESISTDSVRNCLKLLEKWSVIDISNQSGLRLVALNSLYETSRDSLRNVTQRLSNVVPSYSNIYFN